MSRTWHKWYDIIKLLIMISIPSLTTVSTQTSDPNSDAILMLCYICFNILSERLGDRWAIYSIELLICGTRQYPWHHKIINYD